MSDLLRFTAPIELQAAGDGESKPVKINIRAYAGSAMNVSGWGPVVASTLIVRGNHVRTTVGTVNAVEFFVTVAASVTFLLTIGLSNWQMILALAIGGLPAAPIGAWVCKHFPVKRMMVIVGLLVIVLSLRTLLHHFGLF